MKKIILILGALIITSNILQSATTSTSSTANDQQELFEQLDHALKADMADLAKYTALDLLGFALGNIERIRQYGSRYNNVAARELHEYIESLGRGQTPSLNPLAHEFSEFNLLLARAIKNNLSATDLTKQIDNFLIQHGSQKDIADTLKYIQHNINIYSAQDNRARKFLINYLKVLPSIETAKKHRPKPVPINVTPPVITTPPVQPTQQEERREININDFNKEKLQELETRLNTITKNYELPFALSPEQKKMRWEQIKRAVLRAAEQSLREKAFSPSYIESFLQKNDKQFYLAIMRAFHSDKVNILDSSLRPITDSILRLFQNAYSDAKNG